LDGGPPYWLSLLGGVVLSALRVAGMASDRTVVTDVPSVLAGSVWHACSLSESSALGGLDLSRPFPGVGTSRGRELLHSVRPRQEGGVMAEPGLSDWPGPLGLAGPRSFGLKLSYNTMGRSACWLVNALRHPGIINPDNMQHPDKTLATYV
jgi:hypothetical protein